MCTYWLPSNSDRVFAPYTASINVCQLKRPDIRMQSCHVCHSSLLANEEESIYGRSANIDLKGRNPKQTFSSGGS